MTFIVGSGFTIGAGFVIGSGVSPPGPGGNAVVGATEMPLPVLPGFQLEDATATVNGSVGFTINDSTKTGIAISNLTANNYASITNLYPVLPAAGTCAWGPGSSVPSSSVTIVDIDGGNTLVFVVQGQTGAATYNYPFTFTA